MLECHGSKQNETKLMKLHLQLDYRSIQWYVPTRLCASEFQLRRRLTTQSYITRSFD